MDAVVAGRNGEKQLASTPIEEEPEDGELDLEEGEEGEVQPPPREFHPMRDPPKREPPPPPKMPRTPSPDPANPLERKLSALEKLKSLKFAPGTTTKKLNLFSTPTAEKRQLTEELLRDLGATTSTAPPRPESPRNKRREERKTTSTRLPPHQRRYGSSSNNTPTINVQESRQQPKLPPPISLFKNIPSLDYPPSFDQAPRPRLAAQTRSPKPPSPELPARILDDERIRNLAVDWSDLGPLSRWKLMNLIDKLQDLEIEFLKNYQGGEEKIREIHETMQREQSEMHQMSQAASLSQPPPFWNGGNTGGGQPMSQNNNQAPHKIPSLLDLAVSPPELQFPFPPRAFGGGISTNSLGGQPRLSTGLPPRMVRPPPPLPPGMVLRGSRPLPPGLVARMRPSFPIPPPGMRLPPGLRPPFPFLPNSNSSKRKAGMQLSNHKQSPSKRRATGGHKLKTEPAPELETSTNTEDADQSAESITEAPAPVNDDDAKPEELSNAEEIVH